VLRIHGVKQLGQLIAAKLLVDGFVHQGAERLRAAGLHALLRELQNILRDGDRDFGSGRTFILLVPFHLSRAPMAVRSTTSVWAHER
jgi:hypothetical protein